MIKLSRLRLKVELGRQTKGQDESLPVIIETSQLWLKVELSQLELIFELSQLMLDVETALLELNVNMSQLFEPMYFFLLDQ